MNYSKMSQWSKWSINNRTPTIIMQFKNQKWHGLTSSMRRLCRWSQTEKPLGKSIYWRSAVCLLWLVVWGQYAKKKIHIHQYFFLDWMYLDAHKCTTTMESMANNSKNDDFFSSFSLSHCISWLSWLSWLWSGIWCNLHPRRRYQSRTSINKYLNISRYVQ